MYATLNQLSCLKYATSDSIYDEVIYHLWHFAGLLYDNLSLLLVKFYPTFKSGLNKDLVQIILCLEWA
jgi:hypothetical protein